MKVEGRDSREKKETSTPRPRGIYLALYLWSSALAVLDGVSDKTIEDLSRKNSSSSSLSNFGEVLLNSLESPTCGQHTKPR